VRFKQALEIFAGVLRALIRVVQYCPRLATAEDGHQQGIHHQLRHHRRLHRPAHYMPRVQVDDDSDKQPAFASPYVSEVGCPFLVRSCCFKLPVEQVWRNGVDW